MHCARAVRTWADARTQAASRASEARRRRASGAVGDPADAAVAWATCSAALTTSDDAATEDRDGCGRQAWYSGMTGGQSAFQQDTCRYWQARNGGRPYAWAHARHHLACDGGELVCCGSTDLRVLRWAPEHCESAGEGELAVEISGLMDAADGQRA